MKFSKDFSASVLILHSLMLERDSPSLAFDYMNLAIKSIQTISLLFVAQVRSFTKC